MLAPKHNLRILTAPAPVTRSQVTRGADGQIRIAWCWNISNAQRLTIDAERATAQPDYLYLEALHLVLEERNIRANKGTL